MQVKREQQLNSKRSYHSVNNADQLRTAIFRRRSPKMSTAIIVAVFGAVLVAKWNYYAKASGHK